MAVVVLLAAVPAAAVVPLGQPVADLALDSLDVTDADGNAVESVSPGDAVSVVVKVRNSEDSLTAANNFTVMFTIGAPWAVTCVSFQRSHPDEFLAPGAVFTVVLNHVKLDGEGEGPSEVLVAGDVNNNATRDRCNGNQPWRDSPSLDAPPESVAFPENDNHRDLVLTVT